MRYIYGLCDPRTSELRYVGATNNLRNRLYGHCSCKASGHSKNWIASLKKDRLKPDMFVIEEVPDDTWQREEIFWITYFKSIGANLTNITPGGEGNVGNKAWLGRKHSVETKRKMSDANKGKHLSEETKRKLSIAHAGRKVSESTRKKMAIASTGKKYMLGKKLTPEWKKHIGDSVRGIKNGFFGKKHTEETKLKMRKPKRKKESVIIFQDVPQ